MNRKRLPFIAALALAALGAGAYGFYALNDPPASASQRGAQPRAPRAPAAGQDRPGPQGAPTVGHARPRAPGAPSVGQAIPRPAAPARPRPDVPGGIPYPYGYRYPYPGIALGFWYDYWYPYGHPVPPGYWRVPPETVSGSVRLEVSPKDAAVYVDDYYAGTVDDFNGAFRHLTVVAGPHSIEFRKSGFETLAIELYVQPRQTITYRETMQPAQPGSSAGAATQSSVVPGSAASSDVAPGPPGDLRLDVKPKDAQIYVDGYYVGTVDDFNGRHQRLSLAPGRYHVELSASGYESLAFDVNVEPGQTLDHRENLRSSKP